MQRSDYLLEEKSQQGLARLAILMTTLIWGASFVAVKDAVNILPPHLLLTFRFLLSAILLSLVFWKRLRNLNKEILWQGTIIGVLLFFAYSLQTVGIQYTTPGKNAFLTTVYCILVPFFFWLFKGPRPDRYNLAAAVISMAGVGLISLNESLQIGLGDALTLLGGIFYALQIVAIGKFGKGKDPLLISIVQFAVGGTLALITTLLFEPRLTTWNLELTISLFYLVVLCTAVAISLQIYGQKHVPPAQASILFSLESVWGITVSVLMGRDTLTPRLVCGFALIFFSILLSETKLSFLRRSSLPAALPDGNGK